MVLESLWEFMESHLLNVPSTERIFNPFRDEDPVVDIAGSAKIRRENLKAFLSSYNRKPCILVVAVRPSGKGFRFRDSLCERGPDTRYSLAQ